MNIYAIEGHQVKVTDFTKNNGHSFDSEIVKEYLKVGVVYTVKYTEVHRSETAVCLVEFPHISFNSVNFEDACEQSAEDDKKHPDWR